MVEGKASTNLLRGLLFLSPAIFLLAIFTFYPLVNTFVISLKENYNYMNDTFTAWSLSNYIKVFTNSDYPYYLINTILIVFITVPIAIVLVTYGKKNTVWKNFCKCLTECNATEIISDNIIEIGTVMKTIKIVLIK